MPAPSGDMVIDAVDQYDSPIGEVRRSEAFERLLNFRVAHVLVFNRRREILVQQLADARARHALKWGSSVAAYVYAGESYRSAARRRLVEELGIPDAELTAIGKTSMFDEGCLKFIGVFSTVNEGPFDFDRDHIHTVEFVPIREIREQQTRYNEALTPTFLRVLDFYETGR